MRCAGAVAVAVVLVWLAAVPAAAQDNGRIDELGLTVSVGYDNRGSATAWQPVAVRLQPARPLAGIVSVNVDAPHGPIAESVVVEVAAGSAKVYRFVVPAGAVRVSVDEDGAEALTVRARSEAGGDGGYLVGMLGDLPPGLPPLRSETVGTTGAWVAVDPVWLDVSPFAVEPLGTLVVDIGQLQSLSETAQRRLAAGVAAGTDLVVVGPPDTDLAAVGLPWKPRDDDWRLRASDLQTSAADADEVVATTFPAGRARVVLTSVVPGDGPLGRSAELWSTIGQPTTRTQQPGSSEYQVSTTPYQFSRLLAEPGQNAPTLPWLGAFVLVYVVVVGPVNAVVLARMGRRELAWATVPLVTVIFTAGGFLGATAGRPPSGGAATLTVWNGEVGTEMVAAGVRAPTPGRHDITLPGEGWAVRPLVEGASGVRTVRGTDTRVDMDLTALQQGAVVAWRTSDEPAPLQVEARAGAARMTVTVRNVSTRRITGVVVRVGLAERSVPDLDPGAEEEVVMDADRLRGGPAYVDPFEGLPMDSDGIVGLPLSLRSVLHHEVAEGVPGMAWASGAVENPGSNGVAADGQPVGQRGALVAVAARVAPAEGTLSPFTITRDVYSRLGDGYRPGPHAIEGQGEAFLRFRLPSGADPSLMDNELERSPQSGGRPQITVWDRIQRQWVPADQALTRVRPGRIVSALGEVWVRASGELFPFEYSARTIAGGDT